jgi:photosystem II stability/assembly factor-like uncharacterized protein
MTSDRILVGTRKGTFLVDRNGSRWRPRLSGHVGAGVNFVARDPHEGTLWAALGHGHWGAKLSRSTDDGATWEDAPQIAYPEGARHYLPPPPTETGPGEGAPTLKPATLLKLWVLAFGRPGEIHVGTIPGGLFTSRDGGESFELNRGLWDHESRGGDLWAGAGNGGTKWFGTPAAEGEFAPGIHSIVIDPRDPERILVAISTAGVFETTDGGQTWRTRNQGLTMDYSPNPTDEWAGHDPHAVVLCPGDPDHVWQQNHCGVFKSDDGAATWRKVSRPESGVHFGFPVAADARDGATAWLVPGKADMQRTTIDGGLFVARTEDGGQSWTQLREGLPQENAWDVVYRHALGNSGDRLAFGSTTGNLYVSEDHGESWQTVANNLPPIYSVRFA